MSIKLLWDNCGSIEIAHRVDELISLRGCSLVDREIFFSILPRSVPLGSYSVSSEDSIRADAGCSLRDSVVGFLYSLLFWDNSVALPRYFAQRNHPIDF